MWQLTSTFCQVGKVPWPIRFCRPLPPRVRQRPGHYRKQGLGLDNPLTWGLERALAGDTDLDRHPEYRPGSGEGAGHCKGVRRIRWPQRKPQGAKYPSFLLRFQATGGEVACKCWATPERLRTTLLRSPLSYFRTSSSPLKSFRS